MSKPHVKVRKEVDGEFEERKGVGRKDEAIWSEWGCKEEHKRNWEAGDGQDQQDLKFPMIISQTLGLLKIIFWLLACSLYSSWFLLMNFLIIDFIFLNCIYSFLIDWLI